MKTPPAKHATPRLVAVFLLACALAAIVALTGCGSSGSSSAASGSSSDSTAINTENATAFAENWYGDWSFENGEMKLAKNNAAVRTGGYIDTNGELPSKLQELATTRDAARCAVDIEVEEATANTVKLKVEYVSAQNTGLTQKDFDELKEHSQTEEVTFTFDKNNLITKADGLS